MGKTAHNSLKLTSGSKEPLPIKTLKENVSDKCPRTLPERIVGGVCKRYFKINFRKDFLKNYWMNFRIYLQIKRKRCPIELLKTFVNEILKKLQMRYWMVCQWVLLRNYWNFRRNSQRTCRKEVHFKGIPKEIAIF